MRRCAINIQRGLIRFCGQIGIRRQLELTLCSGSPAFSMLKGLPLAYRPN